MTSSRLDSLLEEVHEMVSFFDSEKLIWLLGFPVSFPGLVIRER